MKKSERRKRRDVAASSAALLFNVLPAFMQLPDKERYEQLTSFLEGTIGAFMEAREGKFEVPEPSKN